MSCVPKYTYSSVHIPETRLHSSRMLTARLLTVSPSMHCAGVVCSRGVSAPRGGVCSRGNVCSRGCLLPGMGVSQHTLRQTPHVQNFWHTLLKILPSPKLRLRAVIIFSWRLIFKLNRESQVQDYNNNTFCVGVKVQNCVAFIYLCSLMLT